MSKLFDALTRSLLEKYPADWLNQLGLLHGELVRVMNSDLSTVTAEADKVIRVEGRSPGWCTSSSRRVTITRCLGGCCGIMRC
jgi:hypothetical protein